MEDNYDVKVKLTDDCLYDEFEFGIWFVFIWLSVTFIVNCSLYKLFIGNMAVVVQAISKLWQEQKNSPIKKYWKNIKKKT